MENKFCRGVLSLIFLVLVCFKIPAQQKPFKVGETLPEDFWAKSHQIVNSPTKSINLSEHRGKLILLDFWATWCGSCLVNFLKLEPMIKEFGEQVKVVPVTYQSRAELEKFFATKNGQRYSHIESISDDKYLHGLFPNKGIPYIVWLKDGKVLNATDAPQVTRENIENIWQGDESSLQTVFQLSRDRPLMLAEQFDLERESTLLNYAFLSKGIIRAIGAGNGFHRKGTVVYGRQITNRSLLDIYRAIASQIFESKGEELSTVRIQNLTKEPHLIEVSKTDSEQIGIEKLYSFEFVVPISQADSLYPQMLESLNNNSGYKGEISKQNKKCLVLRRRANLKSDSQTEKLNSGTSKTSHAQLIVSELNELSLTELPIFIHSGLDIELSREILKLSDFDAVKKALKSAGFQLDEEQREILMLVIRDSGIPNPTITK